MMFKNCVLKVDPSRLNYAGYFCLKNFFENINLVERKLKRMTSSYQALVGGVMGVVCNTGCGLMI